MSALIPPDQAASDREHFLRMAAQATGRTYERVCEMDAHQRMIDRALSMNESGASLREIARVLGVHRDTVWRWSSRTKAAA